MFRLFFDQINYNLKTNNESFESSKSKRDKSNIDI